MSAHAQAALAQLIEDGAYERGVNRLRTAHRAQRDRLTGAVRKAAPAGEMWLEQADAGLHCVLAIRTDRAERDIADECRKRGVVLKPLSDFCSDAGVYRTFAASLGAQPAARFLLSYAGMDEEGMRASPDIVAQML